MSPTPNNVPHGLERATQANRGLIHDVGIGQPLSFNSVLIEALRSQGKAGRHFDHNLVLENIFLQDDSAAVNEIRQDTDMYCGLTIILKGDPGMNANSCCPVLIDPDKSPEVGLFESDDFKFGPKLQSR